MNQFLAGVKKRTLSVWNIPMFPILFLMNFLLGLSMAFITPYYSLFGIGEVGMSNMSFGIFMTAMSLSGVIISTYLGKLSDRNVSRKLILIITTVAAIIGFGSFAFIRSYFLLLLIAVFLLGIATATVPQLWAYAREALKKTDVPEKETPYVMNVFRMFFALAWTVGPALAAWVLLLAGFTGLFLFAAFCYALSLVVILIAFKEVPNAVTTQQEPVNLRKFIAKPHIFANIAAFLLLTMATSMNMMNIPIYVTQILGGTEMHVGIIYSIPPIFEVPLMIWIGILATRVDNRILIKIGFLLSVIYFFLLSFVTTPWQIYPLQIISAAQVSITMGIAVTYFQNFLPKEPGTATTLYMNTNKLGQMLGFLFFGIIATYLGYQGVFIVCTALAGVGFLILLLFGKEKMNDNTLDERVGA
ncbi:sugar efflux transporter [Bacillus alkalicellulosilyticus]|uniref:sugar efflux transporter n=1 Tax=Alkalihalobacterium alkalicellulosilyticum TaxID=1912214 RepID=UPI0009985B5E|nr:sugar efflux transporter [Bacillus alkalicellulosilyticus]